MRYRKHLRLKEYDYTNPNYYFVTVCTAGRKELFVPRVSGKYGKLIHQYVAAGLVPANDVATRKTLTNTIEELLTQELPNRFQIEIDFYVFMQDHLHVILVLSDHKGRSYSLGHIIGAFKSLSTRASWKLGYHGRLFQPNFYEHVIRSEQSLTRIRQYILNNPLIAYHNIPWKLIDPNV